MSNLLSSAQHLKAAEIAFKICFVRKVNITMKRVLSLTSFAVALVCFIPLANAQSHGGAADQIHYNYHNSPDAHATVSNAKDTTLVHKKSPSHFKVCSDHASEGTVAVTHDDITTDIDPGNCANVEASRISAKASAEGHHRISVWIQQHDERMMESGH